MVILALAAFVGSRWQQLLRLAQPLLFVLAVTLAIVAVWALLVRVWDFIRR